jgi:hypothetical protein
MSAKEVIKLLKQSTMTKQRFFSYYYLERCAF